MRQKLLDNYRQTAVMLRRSGVPVTPSTLANAHGVAFETAYRAVKQNPWHAEYIGCITQMQLKEKAYRDCVIELQKRGAVVSDVQIARQLELTCESVTDYFTRHPKLRSEWKVLNRYEGTREEYRRAVARLRKDGKVVTRKMVAFELNKTIYAVTTFLKANPEFARTLGVEYTYSSYKGKRKNK